MLQKAQNEDFWVFLRFLAEIAVYTNTLHFYRHIMHAYWKVIFIYAHIMKQNYDSGAL